MLTRPAMPTAFVVACGALGARSHRTWSVFMVAAGVIHRVLVIGLVVSPLANPARIRVRCHSRGTGGVTRALLDGRGGMSSASRFSPPAPAYSWLCIPAARYRGEVPLEGGYLRKGTECEATRPGATAEATSPGETYANHKLIDLQVYGGGGYGMRGAGTTRWDESGLWIVDFLEECDLLWRMPPPALENRSISTAGTESRRAGVVVNVRQRSTINSDQMCLSSPLATTTNAEERPESTAPRCRPRRACPRRARRLIAPLSATCDPDARRSLTRAGYSPARHHSCGSTCMTLRAPPRRSRSRASGSLFTPRWPPVPSRFCHRMACAATNTLALGTRPCMLDLHRSRRSRTRASGTHIHTVPATARVPQRYSTHPCFRVTHTPLPPQGITLLCIAPSAQLATSHRDWSSPSLPAGADWTPTPHNVIWCAHAAPHGNGVGGMHGEVAGEKSTYMANNSSLRVRSCVWAMSGHKLAGSERYDSESSKKQGNEEPRWLKIVLGTQTDDQSWRRSRAKSGVVTFVTCVTVPKRADGRLTEETPREEMKGGDHDLGRGGKNRSSANQKSEFKQLSPSKELIAIVAFHDQSSGAGVQEARAEGEAVSTWVQEESARLVWEGDTEGMEGGTTTGMAAQRAQRVRKAAQREGMPGQRPHEGGKQAWERYSKRGSQRSNCGAESKRTGVQEAGMGARRGCGHKWNVKTGPRHSASAHSKQGPSSAIRGAVGAPRTTEEPGKREKRREGKISGGDSRSMAKDVDSISRAGRAVVFMGESTPCHYICSGNAALFVNGPLAVKINLPRKRGNRPLTKKAKKTGIGGIYYPGNLIQARETQAS
ncbi:hypothetical protein B0H14DRAFT_3690040 [Mycena olivaceomarginata]|nr:hypothetical protein B0H14DRAFT_3690040 [Mycena olivaceomarginata]